MLRAAFFGSALLLTTACIIELEPDPDRKVTLTGEEVTFKDRKTEVFRRGGKSQRYIRVNFRDEPCIPNNVAGCQILADRLSAELPDEFQGGEDGGHSH